MRETGTSLEEAIGRLQEMADEARTLVDDGPRAALTHHLLRMGRTLYSAMSLSESKRPDRMVDLRDQTSTRLG